ncbi:hypothetical protein NW759_003168 [Fusarium solani]|nr:hypothetical protein NW759_003168 [Fusarium solani]
MSDEVSQFLEQVERLRGQQIEEDEVRARELEEYLAAKRERQARREERARSISPQKSSPANTPSPRSSRRSIHLSEALKLESPVVPKDEGSPQTPEPEAKLEAPMDPPDSSPTKENETPLDVDTKSPTTAATPPARSSTLSWQRRPSSRSGAARPLSMLATQNATQRSLAGSQDATPAPASATEQTFSKDQIAQALGSKDPSWFRQTADRGASSAAYRKNQVEDEDRLDMASVKAQLPGMTTDQPKPSPPVEETPSPTKMRLASPPTLNPPGFDGPGDDKPLVDRFARTPSGRTSPIRSNSRSNSPTKGVGGFVQSAMMKRSDSVKRWSVTSPPGLARGDSIASSRSTGLPGTGRPQSMVRPGSTTPSSSRPTSRNGPIESENESTPKAPTIDSALESKTPKAGEERIHVPTSPSKTMDPRRWSPTKSSWLESALNKPESPKPQHRSNTSQPAWMAELNKNKAEKANNPAEGTRPRPGSISHKHQVSIGGLMRSTPVGSVARPNTPGLGGIYSPPPGGNRPPFGHGASKSISKIAPKLEPAGAEEKAVEPAPEPVPEPENEPVPDPELTAEEKQKLHEPEHEEVTSPSETKPPAPMPKPKPETPPKKDFRGSLRHRPTGSEAPKTNEPEFKNVFGNLRRTKTQNYVAPDELKSNILRGKAALNQTGGPQKTERVDEFKEAILKKKDDFKKAQAEGKGITRSNTMAAEQALPEGLARRAELANKRKSVMDLKSAAAPGRPESPKPVPGPKRMQSTPSLSPKPSVSPKPSPKPAAVPFSAEHSNEGLKRISTESSAKPEEPRALPILQKETSAPSILQGRVGGVGGKLAGRFSPALAGMLARGPPPMATNGGASEESGPKGASTSTTEPSAPGPQLTHMTKGRARGPRRKAPTTAAPAAAPATESKPVPKESPKPIEAPVEPVKEAPVKETPAPAPVEKTEESVSGPFSIRQQVAAKAALRGRPTPGAKPQEKEPAKGFQSLEERAPAFLRKQTSPTEPASGDFPSPLRIQKTGDAASQPNSPKKLDTKRMSRFFDEAGSNGAKLESPKEPVRLTHQRTGSRSPVKMFQRPLPEPEPSSPTKVDSDPVVSVKNARAMFGGAAQSPPPPSKPSFDGAEPEVTKTPTRTPRALPEVERSSPLQINKTPSRVANRPLPTPPAKEPQTPKAQQTTSAAASPKPKQGNDVASLLSDFFGPKQPRTEYKVDTASILMNRPPTGPAKIQSLSFQVFQISAEGRKSPVASHYERVLFEREMYIAPHSFTNEAGWKRLEIYFWVGDQVPEAAADDALLFVQKEAKALGGKLVKMQQGKETTEFLQALGGVVMVRRGSSNKYDSLAPNMLCGRQYQGQVSFDECDFTPASLCAGFSYLITNQGKAYLWKGRGCDVTELSAARLIGIELTLTGELIEVDDGEEPESFWALFEGGSKPHSADHWRLKPNYAKYCSRLFCSDADTRQQVFEISPFNQRDLSPEQIYVLDAFFEMYIIVGARAQSRYASFRNALDFAQEYAILASGMEDRPFVPISTVVLEGIPRDLKRVFRFWRDDLSPTATHSGNASAALGTPRRGRSLRVVSLTQALQALSE